MKEMALRKQEMFEAFMNKELGQGERAQETAASASKVLTHKRSELKDLMSGKTVYRPADLQDDEDDVEEVTAPAVHVKKPKRRREKRVQEPEPEPQAEKASAPAVPAQQGLNGTALAVLHVSMALLNRLRSGEQQADDPTGAEDRQQDDLDAVRNFASTEDISSGHPSSMGSSEPGASLSEEFNGMDISPPRACAAPPRATNHRGKVPVKFGAHVA
jgi:hypothetical protein